MIPRICLRFFSTRWSKYPMPGMVKEYADYRKSMKKARRDLRIEADIAHTKAEEKWLEEYTKDQEEKWVRDMDKWRTSVCKIAMHTKRHLDFLKQKDEKSQEMTKLLSAEHAQKSYEKRLMLDAMELESSQWVKAKNEEEMLSQAIFPEAILDKGNYADYTRNVADMMDAGKFEELTEYLNTRDDLDLKNQFLQPLYRNIKVLVRDLTYTEEAKLFLDYTKLRDKIIASLVFLLKYANF